MRVREVVRPRIDPSAVCGSKWGVIGRPKVGCITMPDGRPDMRDRSEHVVERHVGEELATHPLDDCPGEPHASRVDKAAGHDVGVAGDVPALLEPGGRVVLDRHDDDLGAAGRVDGALAALACGERAAQVVVAGTDDRGADRQTAEQ